MKTERNPEVTSIRVVVVEDDPGIRGSLVTLIGGVSDFSCAGSYASGEEALLAIPRFNPHVVLMDINLPQLSGTECVARLKAQLPDVQFLMLTVYDDSERIFESLMQGASGYITKRTACEKLIEAIREAHYGGSPMSPHIARKVVQFFQRRGPATRETHSLTNREREVLEQLSRGYLYKEIADALGIGVETVRRHLSNIYGKLHVQNRTEATVKYLKDHSG